MVDDHNKSESAFVPIKDAQGKTRGMMDRATADYFASTAPNPRQADLDAVFSRVTRVKIVKIGWKTATETIPPEVLIDTSDAAAIADLRQCLLIRDAASHIMTFGMESMELLNGDEVLATLNLIYLSIIRWAFWKNDAVLVEPQRFEDWLASNGAPELKSRAEKLRSENKERERTTLRKQK